MVTSMFDPIIARFPASPRDSSRLFIYDTRTEKISFDRFYNLDRYLPGKSALVLNKTKVVPARITARKETGGKVELLLLVNELQKGDRIIKGLADRKIMTGQILSFGSHRLSVAGQDGKIFSFQPDFNMRRLSEILSRNGKTPIPPYIVDTPLSEAVLRKKYQTVFAEKGGSVAAPTAALHFTPRLFRKLSARGIPRNFVTLHVGLGTFSPVTEENMQRKKLFEEWYEVEEKTAVDIARWKKEKRSIVAVGTTTVRALESWAASEKLLGRSKRGSTDLFILPSYRFRCVDALITNFHLPGSSLLFLVESFLQWKKAGKNLRELYEVAMREKFRFYSFGDAMLIV